jgi:hypothetical protein
MEQKQELAIIRRAYAKQVLTEVQVDDSASIKAGALCASSRSDEGVRTRSRLQ